MFFEMLGSGPSVLSYIFMAIGFLACLIYVISHSNINFGEKYKQTDGKITRSELVSYRSRGKSYYRPEITYEYIIDGEKYTNTRIYKNVRILGTTQLNKVEELLLQYSPGAVVNIYYSPSNEFQSCLQESTKLSVQLLITGIIFFIAGVVLKSGVIDF